MNFKERLNPTSTTRALLSAVPHILISKQALSKMFLYVDECAEEIGWLGTAYKREKKEIYIHDVYLFDQEVHATTTEITPEGLSTFAEEIMQSPTGLDIWNNLKIWGHSHVRMGVTPSQQDDKQMEMFQQGGHDWFLRLIANKIGEIKIDMYNYDQGLIYLDLPWEMEESAEEHALNVQIETLFKQLEAIKAQPLTQYKELITAEIKLKVRKKSYVTTTKYVPPHNQHQSNHAHQSVLELDRPDIDVDFQKKKNGGGVVLDIEKKNGLAQNATKSGENANAEDPNIHFFENDDAVKMEFSIQEIYEFAECKTLTEIEELCGEFGWYNMTDDDLERIMRVSLKTRNKLFGIR
jgi:hypothetical protein